jgi:hypothetical protein
MGKFTGRILYRRKYWFCKRTIVLLVKAAQHHAIDGFLLMQAGWMDENFISRLMRRSASQA